jgi:hypothetical protein
MKRVAFCASLLVLASCGGPAEPPEEAETDTTATTTAYAGPEPGRYTVERTEDGVPSLSTMVINDDKTYVSTMADGTKVTGTFVHRDGMDCFDPEGEEAETCWTREDNATGGFSATTEDGTITVQVTPQ